MNSHLAGLPGVTKKVHTGHRCISAIHQRRCAITIPGLECDCDPGYMVRVTDRATGGRDCRTFDDLETAIQYRDLAEHARLRRRSSLRDAVEGAYRSVADDVWTDLVDRWQAKGAK